MKISGFTFIKNGQILGYPFLESIQSILPIVDEFVINVGESEDETLDMIKSINNIKIRIIKSKWSDKMQDRGFVYGQQKMVAQYNCTGDWAFYIEGDEIYHEQDLEVLVKSMKKHENDKNVEALVVNFYHFYGNSNTILNSPGWYRSEARIIKTSVRSYAPDGLFWVILDSNKKGRYPKAKHVGIECYHYGWVRSEAEMNLKSNHVNKYWGHSPVKVDYSQIDHLILQEFQGTHPKIVKKWLPTEEGLYETDLSYCISSKQRKHRLMITFEKLFGLDLSKKHYILV
tara:strand:- start:1373 stop:2230 length:858 start_codon:yes stop_codon:yes gene_type:complete